MINKTFTVNIPVWILSLDLSKAFDRVSWPALWQALRGSGLSHHMVWLLQQLYADQHGQALGEWGRSKEFSITASVRQGCVLSPRLFCCVLQWAMASWRQRAGTSGFDLNDGQKKLLDLRFA